MTILKSNISNDTIKYEIKDDFILFQISILENEKQIRKLIKFFLSQLSIQNCDLPIRLEVNDYKKPDGMDIMVEENTKYEFRFSLNIKQEDFIKFVKKNFDRILKNKYDIELDYHGTIKHKWYELESDNKNDLIRFDFETHPLGVLFYVRYINDANKLLELVNSMMQILKNNNVLKPFKFRMKTTSLIGNCEILEYNTARKSSEIDFLVKHADFMNFFKKNIIYFAEAAQINYNIQIKTHMVDDDGWEVAVNTKKEKSKAHGKAKYELYKSLNEISDSVL